MNETTKANMRRAQDEAFISRYFQGHGIDIRADSDSLERQLPQFPKITSVQSWDVASSDAQLLPGLADEQFDFVYSSHCLQYLRNPLEGLQNWFRILKPGGYLIVCVPDEDLYGHGMWPPLFNNQHRWSFTIAKFSPALPQSISVIDIIRHFSYLAECERVTLLKDGYDENAGMVDQTLGRAECAIEFVLRKKVLSYEQMVRLAQQLEQQNQPHEAIAYYKKAIHLEPTEFNAINNLSNLVARTVSTEAAKNIWDDYFFRAPQTYHSCYFRALYLISIGKYDEGFSIRDPLVPDLRRSPLAPPSAYPRWQGQDLKGKSIVIWTEFGLGDEIMFARFASTFKSLGAQHVAIVCQKPLVRLFHGLIDIDHVISSDEVQGLGAYDYWVYPHSIPAYYSLEKNGVPNHFPYITLDSGLIKNTMVAVPNKKKGWLRIGLVYQGNPTHENDQLRSIFNLNILADIFRLPNIDWVVLQKGDPERIRSDFESLPFYQLLSISFMGEYLNDFQDSAHVCNELDLLISVDTSIVHLAGALGVPACLLLPTFVDWRWGVNRANSEWYPAIELFRQKITGDWRFPVTQLLQSISSRLSSLAGS